MDDQECPHGAGDPSWCSICLKRPEPEHTWTTDPFECTLIATCRECRGLITPGERIKLIQVRQARGGTKTIGFLHGDCHEE